jgi:hypothetical protein
VKHEAKRPHGIPRKVFEDNIKIDLMDIEYEGVDCIHLALGQGTVAGSCGHGKKPSIS